MTHDTTEQLLAFGLVEKVGNELVITDKGRALIRRGMPPSVPTSYGRPTQVGKAVAIDSKNARSRPHIKKKRRSGRP